jgi:hypothetical protein
MAIKSYSNELLYKIFNNLDDDNNSLFSLLLVNRNWCENAVSILWKRPFNYGLESDKLKKLILILLSQLTLQERIDLKLKDIKDIPNNTMFDYAWFIQQFDTSLLSRKEYDMAIIKTIAMKTERLDELIYSPVYNEEIYKSILTLPEFLLNQITKIKFNATACYSPFFNLSIYIKNIKYLSIKFVSHNHKNSINIFEELIEFISVQNNLEYFIIDVEHSYSNVPIEGLKNWENLFFKLSEHSSHSIKYIMIKGCFNGVITDLNFLSNCSNLEELHLDSTIIGFDEMKCLKDIYLPKLFSFSLLGCYLIPSGHSDKNYYNNYQAWTTYFTEFLRNHRNTLKELKIVSSHTNLMRHENCMKSILNTISLYCENLTLIGLKLDYIFGYGYHYQKQEYDEVLNEFKSFCSISPNLQKIIVYASNYNNFVSSEDLILKFIQSLPKSLKFLSFEGVIELDLLKEILEKYIDNLINLDFYYYTCVDVLKREIDEMTGSKRKLKLKFDKKRISIEWTSIYRYFLDFNYPWNLYNNCQMDVLGST